MRATSIGWFILTEGVEGSEPPKFFPEGVGFGRRSGPLVEEGDVPVEVEEGA